MLFCKTDSVSKSGSPPVCDRCWATLEGTYGMSIYDEPGRADGTYGSTCGVVPVVHVAVTSVNGTRSEALGDAAAMT